MTDDITLTSFKKQKNWLRITKKKLLNLTQKFLNSNWKTIQNFNVKINFKKSNHFFQLFIIFLHLIAWYFCNYITCYSSHHFFVNIFLVWLLFLKFSWINIWNKCFSIFWASVFQLISFCCLFIFLFNIAEKLILTYVKTLVYFFDNIVKFSLQHTWIILFTFFFSFYKMFYTDQFIFFILWNFHCNTHKQCCLLFFYYFSKLSMQTDLSFWYCETFITTHVNDIVYFFSLILQNILHESQCQNLIMMTYLIMRRIRNSSNLIKMFQTNIMIFSHTLIKIETCYKSDKKQ